MDKLTSKEYWDHSYSHTNHLADLPNLQSFHKLALRRIVETLESVSLEGKKVLEVGAGDSSVLLHLAKRYEPTAEFFGLDYSPSGCAALRARAERLSLNISVTQADMFEPPETLCGQFDVVYSNGLVEHFAKLENPLCALAKFLKPGGVLVTIIPNMSGILGSLSKLFNRAIYDIHNPHNLYSFLKGHGQSRLTVLRSGYLCSNNFLVLASCFPGRRFPIRPLYLSLVAITAGLWLFESKVAELPKTRIFSPYLYAISRDEDA